MRDDDDPREKLRFIVDETAGTVALVLKDPAVVAKLRQVVDATGDSLEDNFQDVIWDLAPEIARYLAFYDERQLTYAAVFHGFSSRSNCRDWIGAYDEHHSFSQFKAAVLADHPYAAPAFELAAKGDWRGARECAMNIASAQGWDKEPTFDDFAEAERQLGKPNSYADEAKIEALAQRLYNSRHESGPA